MEAPASTTEDIEWSSPDNLINCMKDIKSGAASVSFGWTETKLGESQSSIEDLCDLLLKSKTHALDLENAKLSNGSVELMCNALKKNKSLHTLVITNNGLGALSGKAIVEMLKLNKTLKHIALRDGNPDIPVAMLEAIDAALKPRGGAGLQ